MSDTFVEMAKQWDRTAFDRMLSAAKENGYRKKDIADELRVPASTISEWVKGNHAPHPLFQEQFAKLEARFTKHPKKKGVKK